MNNTMNAVQWKEYPRQRFPMMDSCSHQPSPRNWLLNGIHYPAAAADASDAGLVRRSWRPPRSSLSLAQAEMLQTGLFTGPGRSSNEKHWGDAKESNYKYSSHGTWQFSTRVHKVLSYPKRHLSNQVFEYVGCFSLVIAMFMVDAFRWVCTKHPTPLSITSLIGCRQLIGHGLRCACTTPSSSPHQA